MLAGVEGLGLRVQGFQPDEDESVFETRLKSLADEAPIDVGCWKLISFAVQCKVTGWAGVFLHGGSSTLAGDRWL